MISKTNSLIDAAQPRSGIRSAASFRTRFAQVSNFFAHFGPFGRGLVMLCVLVLAAILSVSILYPRRTMPANAPLDVFSSARAMVHLPVIAAEPHPVGSPAQWRVRDYLVRELTASDLEVEIQKAGTVQNVVARLPGSDPSGAIVILSHYDTVSYSPGAGDNGSAVSVLLEVMRALAAGPALRNDVIALFDDAEEIGPFAGTYAFVDEFPGMKDVRVAISLDTAVAGFISTNEVGPKNNGWLVDALAQSYSGGAWMSFSGGGQYNSTPFREAGIQVLALEDNYPFRQKHTEEDLPNIIQPYAVQQMGEQTLAIARQLGGRDLTDPRGEQETFFSIPVLGFIHYPQDWSPALGVSTAALLLLALGLALWRKFISWRGLGTAFGTILLTTVLSVLGVGALQPQLPGLFGWQTSHWQEYPEVIPPHGWLAAALLGLLVLGLCGGGYSLARRWSRRADFSLAGLIPFCFPAVVLAIVEPRTAYAFTWPVFMGALVWIIAAVTGWKLTRGMLDVTVLLAALTLVIMLLPFLPGIIMSDGMKSLNILAGIEALLLAVSLPVIDGLLVRRQTSSEE